MGLLDLGGVGVVVGSEILHDALLQGGGDEVSIEMESAMLV